MKMMKLALLGSAALVAASAGARAENLDALKAQIEALNARMATIEATPSVPAGYSLVSFSRGTFETPVTQKEYSGAEYHLISIVPTADAPAAAGTTVGWSGSVSAGAGSVYTNSTNTTTTDIRTKMGLNVTGKTETAVGEVGASVSLKLAGGTPNAAGGQNGGNQTVSTDGFSGWWKMTDKLTLKGGILGRLSDSSYDWDSTATNVFWGKTLSGVAVTTSLAGDPAAFQLGYADGPVSFAVQAEDGGNAAGASGFGMSTKAGYSMDMLSFDVGAGYWSKTGTGGTTDAWSVSGGAQANLGQVKIGGAIGTGVDHSNVTSTIGSLYATAALNDSISLEAGITNNFSSNVSNYGVGLYYKPVNKLTLGLEGGAASNGDYSAGLVTVFKF